MRRSLKHCERERPEPQDARRNVLPKVCKDRCGLSCGQLFTKYPQGKGVRKLELSERGEYERGTEQAYGSRRSGRVRVWNIERDQETGVGLKNQKRSLSWPMSLAPETLSFLLPKMAFMRARKSGMRIGPVAAGGRRRAITCLRFVIWISLP